MKEISAVFLIPSAMEFRGQVAAPGRANAPAARPRAQSPSPQANNFAPSIASAGSTSSAKLRAVSPQPAAPVLSFGGPASARGVPSVIAGAVVSETVTSTAAPAASGAADARVRQRVVEELTSAPKLVSVKQVPKVQLQEGQMPLSPIRPQSPMRARSPTPVRMQSSTNLTTSVRTQAASTTGMQLNASMRAQSPPAVAVPPAAVPAAAVPTMVTTQQPLSASMRTQAGVPIFQMTPVPGPARSSSNNAMVAVPMSTLTHIDGIVSEMERELSEIRASEVRQEVLELKEKHLSQLRRLLAEELYNSNDRDEKVKVGPGRLTILESDQLLMKQQVSEIQQKNCDTSRSYSDVMRMRSELEAELVEMKGVVEAEKLRARLAEDRLAEFEATTVQAGSEEIRKLEAALECEQRSSAEAVEARITAESDLQKLEASFRAMMDDCQALQVKIQEVTAERDLAIEAERVLARDGIDGLNSELENRLAQLEEKQARIVELEEETQSHLYQVTVHKSRNGELEVQLNDLHSELQTHRGHHETKDKRIQELIDDITSHSEQSGKHRTRAQELEQLLAEAKDESDGHHRQHSANKTKIGELEQLLADAQAEAARHQSTSRQAAGHRARVQELESELLSSQADKDNHHRQHLKRIADLERQHEELRLGEQNHTRQHTAHRSRIQELERVLAERESAEGNHTRQHNTNRARIKELEQQLLDVQTSHDNHVRQNKEHRRRITELQQELESNRFSDGDRARLDKAHRAALTDLQNQLNDAETEQKKYMTQSVAHRQRISELDSELLLLRDGESNHQRMHATHKKRIKDMEDELANQETFHSRKNAEARARVEELTREMDLQRERIKELENAGPPAGAVDELDSRVANLMQEIEKEREALAASRIELNSARAAAESVQQDADKALSAQEALLRSRTSELEEKLAQALQTIKDLEGQLARHQNQRSLESSTEKRTSTQSKASSPELVRSSLYGQVRERQVGLTGTLLPGSSDVFVAKVRAACKASHDALKIAAEMNMRCLRIEVQRLREDSTKGISLKTAVSEFKHRLELLSERRAAADVLESSISDLRAYREELEIQRQLSASEHEDVSGRIELDIERCQDELALLHSTSSLSELPEVVLQGVVDLHVPGATPSWADGFSPMHWAAQYGRQDIIEYLVSTEGGRALLEAPDSRGHAPLYYAQLGNRKSLIIWLTEELGTKAPVHTHQQTPTFTNIPESYQKVLVQIRTHGWRSMSWRDGYTMLHWAANKGHKDICTYLVELDADPNRADGHGRTPIDIARNAGNQELTSLLQDLRSRRRASRRV